MTDLDLDRATVLLQEMADLQDAHNRHVASDWRSRGFPYYRAVWVECAELLDHFGWKWWKQQQPDLAQARLEVVDIWHFGLSMLLLEDGVDAHIARTFLAQGQRAAVPFREAVEALAGAALQTRRFDVEAFTDIMNALDMDLPALAREYVGKNVLNNFRQAHGYNDGSYSKIWAGREDNEHLVELLTDLDPAAGDFQEHLWAALQTRYRNAG